MKCKGVVLLYKEYEIDHAIKNYMMRYSKSVIVDRAIVSVEDGLKPSQRLEIWSLYHSGVRYNKKRVKSLTATGEAMKYVPHGDSSVYETMARMAQTDTFLYPLIDGKGNMGQHTGRDVYPSASRYTNMRLTEFSEELFRNIEKNAVDFVPNFDNSIKQPDILPSTFPSTLVFGSSGIAVGFASNIPSFNMEEVCNYTIDIIKGNKTSLLIPDFATKGEVIYDEDELKKIEDQGEGRVLVRGTYRAEGDIIIIDSIPFTTTREAIIEKIIDLAKIGKMKEVKDARDGTDKNGMTIEIDIKKGTDIASFMSKVYKMTTLESGFSCNMNVIYKDKPVKMGTKRIVESWIDFRRETVKRITSFEMNKNEAELKMLNALSKVVLNIDKAIDIIKNSSSDAETVKGLMDTYSIGKEEAEIVSNFRLKNLNKSHINQKLSAVKVLEKTVKSLEDLLKSDKNIDDYIVKDLNRVIEKHKKDRQTNVIQKKEIIEIPIAINEPEDYNLKLFITKDLYLKKLPLTSMRGKYTNRLKEDDSFTSEEEMTNLGEVIVFTNQHNIYKKRLSEIEDTKPSELGEYLPSMFNYEKGEKPLFAIPMRKEFDQVVVLGFSDGTLAKVDSQAYYTKQNRTVLKNGYADKELLYVSLNGNVEYLKCVTESGYSIVRDMSQFNPKASRTTSGSRFINLNEDDRVISYEVATEEDAEKYLMKSAGRGKKK